MKTVGIMQPYFLPYLGYFHLISSVDVFVIYDDIQYTKQGWINRNRLILNGSVDYFSIPLVKDSGLLNVNQRMISPEWQRKRSKILKSIRQSYRKRNNFERGLLLSEEILNYNNPNLFNYIHYSVDLICRFLGINTEIVVSSSLGDFSEYKGKDKVIEICKSTNADRYVNSIGGMNLYDKDEFGDVGLDLKFVKSLFAPYNQNRDIFEPGLSILDIVFSISDKASLLQQLQNCELV